MCDEGTSVCADVNDLTVQGGQRTDLNSWTVRGRIEDPSDSYDNGYQSAYRAVTDS